MDVVGQTYLSPNSMEFQCMSFQKSICSIHAIRLRLYDTPIVDVQYTLDFNASKNNSISLVLFSTAIPQMH